MLGERVTRVGVAAGEGPVQQMPGARDKLDDNDLRALSFMPDEPARAAEQFLAGGAELIKMTMSARDDEQAYLSGMAAADQELHQVALPPQAAPRLQHLLETVTAGLERSVSPALAGEPSGWAVTPTTWTWRVLTSITKNT